MKLASTLFGVIAAQDYEGSGQDYTDSVTDYSDESERGKIKNQYQPVSSYNNNYQLSYNNDDYYGRSGSNPTAVTCWESNNMGTHDSTAFDQHSHEGLSPKASSDALENRDVYGWRNIHANHNTTATAHNAHSLDAYDHRLSGCIYELSSFTYGSGTYSKYYDITFTEGTLSPVWWHYFNAHVLPGGTKKAHKIVMANPTYEGLGYLNFIITFIAKTTVIDGTLGTYINTDESLHTDAFAANNVITISAATGSWYSTFEANSGIDGAGTWNENVAISSFPHNDLGKDFRFNIRILHQMGEGDQTEAIDSYYWYKVNDVTITFPATVGCPWDTYVDGSTKGSFRCMDSADQTGRMNGHISWVSVDSNHEDNEAATFLESFLDGTVNNAVCSTTYSEDKMSCGTKYKVAGLMNTYDEYAQQEYGTHQEFWFQFEYYMPSTATNVACERNNYGCYQAPNMLFNAFEVSSIDIDCNTSGLYNGNRCTANSTVSESVETWS